MKKNSLKPFVPKKYKNDIKLQIAYLEGGRDEIKKYNKLIEKEINKQRGKFI